MGYVVVLAAETEESRELSPGGGPMVESAEEPGAREPGTREPPSGEPEFDVRLRINPIARLTPPPRPRPQLRLWQGTSLVPAEAEWVAGTAALPFVQRPTGRQLVRFRLPGGIQIYRIVHLGERDGAEPIDLHWRGSAEVRGRVLDGETQKPLAGARIWLQGQEAKTGVDGRFHFPDVPRGSGVPVVIRAEGFAGMFRVLDLEKTPNEQTTHALAKGVDLRVRFQSRAADLTRARVFVMPAGDTTNTRLIHHPFFMQALEGGTPVRADGSATLTGLPRDVSLRVVVHHPDTLVQERPVVDTSRRSMSGVVVAADPAGAMAGKITDVAGAAVAGAWLFSGAGDDLRMAKDLDVALLPPALYLQSEHGSGHVVSDAQGSYRLPVQILRDPKRAPMVAAVAADRHGLQLQVRLEGGETRRDLVLPGPGDNEKPGVGLVFPIGPGGRKPVFRLEVLEGSRIVQRPFRLRAGERFLQPLARMLLADITVELRRGKKPPRTWTFRNQVITGPVFLPLKDWD